MADLDDPRSLPVAELKLSLRVRSRLSAAGIKTCGDLAARSQLEVLDIGDLNAGSLDEIQEQLGALGLRLRTEDQQ